ncbi:trafficking protein particle complex subunit 2-like protein isoform X4 [Saimiri boliviensis]|uniref:trafficking protein particle complex subunit 2-like protein isoform X4 n=1 Tax=Saimiri boliviensis TaxID=27679 RepID=UPI00193D91C4|nr:trafficking protein particle complex subunit 2-like protein isoform X4 [Saimiri boliviensis boliviensis]
MRRSLQWGRPSSTRGSCTWACSTPQRTTRLPCFSQVRAHRGPLAARYLICCPSSPFVTSAFPNQLCRYGYVTNSKVKFVMVVDSSNTALRDNEIRSMFRKLHNSYTDVMCNPFYNPGDRIQSRAFDNMVTSMMIQVC